MRRSAVAAALIFLTSSAPARAEPIFYITTGVGSGGLGPIRFTDQAFTITMFADTDDVQSLPFTFGVKNLSTTVRVGATPATGLPGSSYARSRPGTGFGAFFYSQVLVGEEFDEAQVDLQNTALNGYDLKGPFGPITGGFFLVRLTVPTDQGDFFVDFTSRLSFRATVVPEPSTLTLAAIGGVALVGVIRRRRLKRT